MGAGRHEVNRTGTGCHCGSGAGACAGVQTSAHSDASATVWSGSLHGGEGLVLTVRTIAVAQIVRDAREGTRKPYRHRSSVTMVSSACRVLSNPWLMQWGGVQL